MSMGFSRQEYWSGLPFPSPGDLPNPGITPRSLALQVDSLPSAPAGKLISLNEILEVQIKDFKHVNTCKGPNTCFQTACLRGCVSLCWRLCRLEGSPHKRRCRDDSQPL